MKYMYILQFMQFLTWSIFDNLCNNQCAFCFISSTKLDEITWSLNKKDYRHVSRTFNTYITQFNKEIVVWHHVSCTYHPIVL